MKLAAICAIGALLSFATSANALTYTASRDIGDGHAEFYFETDGTLGALTAANFLDWKIVLTNPAGAFTLTGPLSGGNSEIRIDRPIVRATEYSLTFNLGYGYEDPSRYPSFIVQTKTFGGPGYCLMVGFSCVSPSTNNESFWTQPMGVGASKRSLPDEGLFVIASNGGPPVPEPTVWALMILGFGLAGATLRRQRARSAVYA